MGCDRLQPDVSLLHQPIAPNERQMSLTSSAFDPGQPIPAQYTCDGKDHSPPLQWTSAPRPDSRSLALILYDPDAPGRTFIHWVVYNLPPTLTQLPSATPSDSVLANGGRQGRNDFRRYGYGGPCPPKGQRHRYVFRLYALDQAFQLADHPSQGDILQQIEAHHLAIAELAGFYTRQR